MFGKIPEKIFDFIKGRIKVSLYAKGVDEGDTPVLVQDSNYGNLRVSIYEDDNYVMVSAGNADDTWNYGKGIFVVSKQFCWNEDGWDRVRNNTEVALLPPATRNSTTVSATQTNYNAKGCMIFFDVTAITETESIQLVVEAYDIASGKFFTIFTANTITAVGSYKYILYPSVSDVTGDFDAIQSVALPRTWRVSVLHSGSGNFTYSVGASLIL